MFKSSIDEGSVPEYIRDIDLSRPISILYEVIQKGTFESFLYMCGRLNKLLFARIDILEVPDDNGTRNNISFYHWIIINKQAKILEYVLSPYFKKNFPNIILCNINIGYGDRRNAMYQPPVAFALRNNDLEMAEIIIKAGALLMIDLGDSNLLQCLAINKNSRSLAYILENHRDKLGDIKTLLNAPVKFSGAITVRTSKGPAIEIKDFKTAAFIALTNLDLSTLILLLKNGVDLRGAKEYGYNIIHLLVIDLQVEKNEKPLELLFSEEVLAFFPCRFLNEINQRNILGESPLILLCESKIPQQLKLSCIKLLLLNGAELSYMVENTRISLVRQLVFHREFDLLSKLRSQSFQDENPMIPKFYVMDNENLELYLFAILGTYVDFFSDNFNAPKEALDLIDELLDVNQQELRSVTNKFYRLSLEKGNAIWCLFQCVIESPNMTYAINGIDGLIQFVHEIQEIAIERHDSTQLRIHLLQRVGHPQPLDPNKALLIQEKISAYTSVFIKARELYDCSSGEISIATILFLLDKKREIAAKLEKQKLLGTEHLSDLEKLKSENEKLIDKKREIAAKLEKQKLLGTEHLSDLEKLRSENEKLKAELLASKAMMKPEVCFNQLSSTLKKELPAEQPSIKLVQLTAPVNTQEPVLTYQQRINKLNPTLREFVKKAKVALSAALKISGYENDVKTMVNSEIEILLTFVEHPTNYKATENFNMMVNKYCSSANPTLYSVGNLFCVIGILAVFTSIAMLSIAYFPAVAAAIISKTVIDTFFAAGCVTCAVGSTTLITGLAMTIWARPGSVGPALQAVKQELNSEELDFSEPPLSCDRF